MNKKILKKLAIYGGDPVIRDHNILISKWPKIEECDIADVAKIMRDEDFSGRNSKIIRNFEQALCNYLGIKCCSLFNSGTAALHGCINALNIGIGDEVIVPAYTFLAPAMAVLHNGAIPIFCDVDSRTFNINPNEIEKLITNRTKAVIAVNMHGLPADLIKIRSVCIKNNLKLVEDCAQSFGAKIDGQYCGTFGDLSAFSFMSAKQLATCGELGAITTNVKTYQNRANILKTYGEILCNGEQRRYNSYSLGYNYVANTIQTKVAHNKLRTFNRDIKSIIINAKYLSDYLKNNIPFLIPPFVPKKYGHVYHFFRVVVDGVKIGYKNNGVLRQAIMDIMDKEGLKLRLYQNTPVCGQYIFRTLNKIGGGYPFIVNKDDEKFYKNNYNIHNYPNTLRLIEESFVVGGLGAAPLYFQSKDTVKAYIRGFEKIKNNMKEVIDYAESIEGGYQKPWEDISKISDTNNKFELFV